MSIAVCIPCCGKHLHYLRRCLDSIEAQTVKPTKVVVSCSSTILPDLRYDGYSFPVKVLMTPVPKNAAENRNRTIEYADTDYVTFIDVDDTMHPERIEFILQAFSNRADIVLHALKHGQLENTPINPFIFYDALVPSPTGCAMVRGSRPWLESISIHHAQVSVRREILNQVRFPEEVEYIVKTDSIFCGTVLSLPNIRSAYILNPLTSYIPSKSVYETNSRPLIFCFWMGETPLPDVHKEHIEDMKRSTECEVVLITKDTLDSYILPEAPLHRTYSSLSGVQKTNYIRAYFMHFYGHGYSELKNQSGSWLPAFQTFYESNAHALNNESAGIFICRPQTPYTEKCYNEMLSSLDRS